QESGTVSAAHQRARPGDDRQVVRQRFQRARPAGPAEAVQHDVAYAGRGDEAVVVEARQDLAVTIGTEPEQGERTRQAAAKQVVDARVAIVGEEDELAVADLARDPREYVVVLRLVLEQGLGRPEQHRVGPQAELGAIDRDRGEIGRLVI